MEEKLEHTILRLLFSRESALLLIMILFFLVWSEVVFKYEFVWYLIPMPLVIWGALGPIILLVAALKYDSCIAFYITLAIFTSTVLIEIFGLPYYIQQHYFEQLNGWTECYCNPLAEIKMSCKLIWKSVAAILLMHTNKVVKPFNLKKVNSLKLIVALIILYLIFRTIFWIF